MDKDGTKWMIVIDLFAWGCVIYTHKFIYESKELLRVHTCPDVEWCNIPYLNMHQDLATKGPNSRFVSMSRNKSPNMYSACKYKSVRLVWALTSDYFLHFGSILCKLYSNTWRTMYPHPAWLVLKVE